MPAQLNTTQIFHLFLSFRAYRNSFAIFFKVIDILPADMETIVLISQDEHVQAYHVSTIQIIQSVGFLNSIPIPQ